MAYTKAVSRVENSGKVLSCNLMLFIVQRLKCFVSQSRLKTDLLSPGNTKGWRKYHCTVDLLFDWFGISCMTTDNFCFYLQNRLLQTSQAGGQQYSDSSPFNIPWCTIKLRDYIIHPSSWDGLYLWNVISTSELSKLFTNILR